MYELLRKLGTRNSKPYTGTSLTTEDFRNQFSEVSAHRYENTMEKINEAINLIEDRRTNTALIEANKQLNSDISDVEMQEAMEEVKDSAPGKDEVRMRYIREACAELKINIMDLITRMFNSRAASWSAILKIGLMVAIFKKGNRNEAGNYRGVVLLSMASRILARILAKRLRNWTEKYNILSDNQNGFRQTDLRRTLPRL